MIDHKLENCINFGDVKVHYPCGITIVTGFYNSIKFQFSDVTIKTLGFELNNWVRTASEVEKTELTRV